MGKRRVIVVICFIVAVSIVLNFVGYIYDIKAISVMAVYKERNKYEVISELLLDSLDEIGTCSPEDTARVWAKGLQMRSGAMQACVMTKELRKNYIKELEKDFANWVTGVSSPWVEKYEIIENTKQNDKYRIKIKFETMTSTGPDVTYYAVLEIEKEDGYWRIYKIVQDEGLKVYTG